MRALGVLAFLVLALSACGGSEPGAGSPETGSPEAGATGPLAEFRGEPVVANVWASW